MKICISTKLVPLMIACLGLLGTGRVFADTPKTDGEILGILMASDQSEIDAARQAEGKNISAEVMDYAKMLDREHSDDLNKLQSLQSKMAIEPPATAGVMEKAKGAKGMAVRTVLNGHDFEKSYINDMVQDHTDDINLITNELMNDAKNPDLKEALADARSHMQNHLDKAKALQSKL